MEDLSDISKPSRDNYKDQNDPLDPVISRWHEIMETTNPRLVGSLDLENGRIEYFEVIEDATAENIILHESSTIYFSIKIKPPQVPEDVIIQLLDVALENPIKHFRDPKRVLEFIVAGNDFSTIFDVYFTLKGAYPLYSGNISDIGNLLLMISQLSGEYYISGISFDGTSYFRVVLNSGMIRAYRARGKETLLFVKIWKL
ncbi:hypothetical protein A3L04_10050 [Thermococcus chitonophagus]|uniref:Uncharacterized protein n=1 Tax=Thermococcus chitonophagus TaxID=54262 RepID=A0A160VSF6_9EURY|nr:hypothetical protein [Thermococcus chitonophagus]ASJ17385.1 hypothetical protein A3L04_10050 [Thermococcus chitonophagus]CUX78023.1 hypothetical protein CHITON_1244 [Thermococcus chitonophagus]